MEERCVNAHMMFPAGRSLLSLPFHLYMTCAVCGATDLMDQNQQTELNTCSEPGVFVVVANGVETASQPLAGAWR